MDLRIKMETVVEIKASADQFYDVFRKRSHHLPAICSDVDTVEVQDGGDHVHGSSRQWTYKFGGKSEIFKEKIEFDDKNKKATHVGCDGDLFKRYKVFKGSWQAIPNPGGKGAIAKIVIEYQKLSKEFPSPEDYLLLMVGLATDIDAYLSKV